MRLLFTLQYLGTRYAGWQSQTNATAIQDVVERALAQVYGVPIRVEAAGRTDAGVHAIAQRAHCDVPFAIPARGLVLGLNNRLPHDIRITAVEECDPTFHCRFVAKSKTYVYRIWNAEVLDVFRAETYAHVAGPLADDAMADGLRLVLGEHDFRAFTVAAPEVSSTMRRVTAASVSRDGSAVEIRITADGFVRYMVRRITGSAIEIGRGKLDSRALLRSLEPTFEVARWTAPAKGLTLESVSYE